MNSVKKLFVLFSTVLLGFVMQGAVLEVGPGQAYTTIQAAIDAATAGDTINVAAGTYTEVVTIDRPLTLLGANANVPFGSRGAETKVQDTRGYTIMTVKADDVTINGFELYGPLSNNAITSQNDPVGRSRLSFMFNHIHDIGTQRGSGNVYGFQYMVAGDTPSNIKVTDNLVENIGNAATLVKGSGGIYFGQNSSVGTLAGVLIERNIVRNVKAAKSSQMSRGIIIGVGSTGGGSVTGLIIGCNEVSDISAVAFMGVTPAFGIVLSGNTPGALVRNNIVTLTKGAAVAVETNSGAATVLIVENDLTGAATGIGNTASQSVNATNNWFGSATGPKNSANPGGTGATVTTKVNFSPWLVDGTDIEPDALGFQPYYLPARLEITIGDRVWLDDNGNGVMDAGESGVSNVVVRLLDESSNLITNTLTSVDGSYKFNDLPHGSYQVEVVRPAGYAFTLPDAVAELPISGVAQATGLSPVISVTEGGTHVTMYAGVYLPAVLHGSLFMDKDGNELSNTGDLPITNALVTLTVNGVAVTSTNSNAEGNYYFTDVPPGAVTLLVSHAEATLVGVPEGEDPMRNRALPVSGATTAFISYTITSGYGVLDTLPSEPLNFGFTVHPLSTQIDLRVYAAADGRVMIEISTVNENGKYAIEIFTVIDGDWKPVATVPSEQIVGFGSNTYTAEAVGLTPGVSYRFKIVDESGHIFESDLIEVARTQVAVEAMTLLPQMIKIVFPTKPGKTYQVMVCETLGAPWKVEDVQFETKNGLTALSNEPFTVGRGDKTEVLVPRSGRAKAFFKIIRVP